MFSLHHFCFTPLVILPDSVWLSQDHIFQYVALSKELFQSNPVQFSQVKFSPNLENEVTPCPFHLSLDDSSVPLGKLGTQSFSFFIFSFFIIILYNPSS